MDPKELDSTIMPEANNHVTPETMVERISESLDFNYDVFGCFGDELDDYNDVILFI